MKVCAATLTMDFDAVTGKKCCHCLVFKPFSEFWISPLNHSGYVGRCKGCSKKSAYNAGVALVPPKCQVNAAWRQPKTCVQCGQVFFAKAKSQGKNKSCSDACRRAATSQWNREHSHERVWPVKPKPDRKLQATYGKRYAENRKDYCLGQCLHCKQDIMGRRRNRVITFCSLACRVAHKTIQGRQKICVNCKEAFTVVDTRTCQRKTCSDTCHAEYSSKVKLGVSTKRLIPHSWVKFCNCIVCEKLYTVGRFSPWKGKNCCSSDCIKKHISRTNTLPPEERVRVVCHWCQKESLRLPSSIKQKSPRIFCDRKCSGAWFASQMQGPHWFENRYGKKPLWNYGWSWKSSQGTALRRDKNTCRICKKTEAEIGQKPDVHHVIPFASFGKARHLEANALSNLLCLCRSCHMTIEPKNYVKWRRAQALGDNPKMSKELAYAVSQIKVLRAMV